MKLISRFILIMAILAIMFIPCAALAYWNVPISEVENNSRYTFVMQDSNGNEFMVYIYSTNERQLTGHTWFSTHPQVFTGDYRAAIVPKGARMATIQEIYLFGLSTGSTNGIFDLNDKGLMNSAYVVRTPYENQPDVLIISQRSYATAADMRAFFIDDGTLYLIHWRHQNDRISNSVGISYDYPVKCTDYLTFNTRLHIRSMEYTGYIYNVWKFDPDARLFNMMSRIYGN